MHIKLHVLEQPLAVCKLKEISQLDLKGEFLFFCKTDEELSLACPEKDLPANTLVCEKGWRGMRIEGMLDFSLIGIISKISGILADNSIGIFVVSTYNTDYILVKEEQFSAAKKVLSEKGYIFE
ncbi:MAG: ACT domain-containing protein [Clostridiales bacterium]|nr:ACT domain-containing protein [Clostridiales bacterium]